MHWRIQQNRKPPKTKALGQLQLHVAPDWDAAFGRTFLHLTIPFSLKSLDDLPAGLGCAVDI